MEHQKQPISAIALALDACTDTFTRKILKYGASFQALRLPALCDLMLNKVARLKNLENKVSCVEESHKDTWIAIANYALIALYPKELAELARKEPCDIAKGYIRFTKPITALRNAKNSDYAEAWREMDMSSFVDIVHTKLLRNKQLLQTAKDFPAGKKSYYQDIYDNLIDTYNYAIFALARIAKKEYNSGRVQASTQCYVILHL